MRQDGGQGYSLGGAGGSGGSATAGDKATGGAGGAGGYRRPVLVAVVVVVAMRWAMAPTRRSAGPAARRDGHHNRWVRRRGRRLDRLFRQWWSLRRYRRGGGAGVGATSDIVQGGQGGVGGFADGPSGNTAGGMGGAGGSGAVNARGSGGATGGTGGTGGSSSGGLAGTGGTGGAAIGSTGSSGNVVGGVGGDGGAITGATGSGGAAVSAGRPVHMEAGQRPLEMVVAAGLRVRVPGTGRRRCCRCGVRVACPSHRR